MMIGVFLHIDNDIHSKTDSLVTAKSIGGFKVSQYICLDLEKETIKQESCCSGIAYDERSERFLLFIDKANIADKDKILEMCSIPSSKVECLYDSYKLFYRKLLKRYYGSLYYEFRDIIHEVDPSHIAIVPDEYELEVDAILAKLIRSRSIKYLDVIIKEVFEYYLDGIEEKDIKSIVEVFSQKFGHIENWEEFDCLDSYIGQIRIRSGE